MVLSSARVALEGKTAFAHEKEAIEFAKQELPNVDPYQVWALAELLDPSTGRIFEIDLIVLGYRALYLVEIKSHPGRISGDAVDWTWEPPDGGRRYLEPPYALTNRKARVLKSRLQQKMQGARVPWVQPLVFLSSPDLDLRVTEEGRVGVVTRGELRKALTHHEFPSAQQPPSASINTPTMREVVKAMRELGLRPRKGMSHVGPYALGEVLEDGTGYQDREAVHRDNARMRARARTYLVVDGTTIERRQTLARAARREANLLYDVREHPSVLHLQTFVEDAPVGPTLLLEDFAGGMPLPAFLRANPELSFKDKVEIIEQVGRTLAFCHRRNVLHSALSPHCILVRRRSDEEPIETRLYDFQLGASDEIEGTRHWSALASAPWALYQAPELREDVSSRTPVADMFSLGAVAFYLLAGRAPAESLTELTQLLLADGKLDIRAVERLPKNLAELIDLATDVSPAHRYDDVGTWVEDFALAAQAPNAPPTAAATDPLTANKDDILGDFLVKSVLGQGATARVLQVESSLDTRTYALKISLGPEHDERIRAEGKLLARLDHPRIVKTLGEHVFAGRFALQLALAGDETLQRHLQLFGTVSLEFGSRYGEDLLSALEHLQDKGVVHRDIKPANLGVGSAQKTQHHLTLFDFSLVDTPITTLDVGTSTYRDPFLLVRGSWDPSADRWSAAVTLHEMLTGARPSYEGTALSASAKLRLTPERFDASVRDQLVAFFTRALDREVERRFASAGEMRSAWSQSFEAPRSAKKSDRPIVASGSESLTEFDAAKVSLDAAIESLPLSANAKNALDRAALRAVRDLLGLPENRLSAIRGVGREVAREVLDLRDAIRAAQSSSVEAPALYAPDYRGPDTPLSALALPRELLVALEEAGLVTLGTLAKSSAPQVDALVARARVAKKLLRDALTAAQKTALANDRADTVEAWLTQLLHGSAAKVKHVKALLGLAAPFEGQINVTARKVAQQAGMTDANIYIALGALRTHWSEHPSYPELEALVATVLETSGSAMSLESAAEGLLTRLPSQRTAGEPLRVAGAAALVRIVTEVEKESPGGIRLIRLRGEEPWVVASQDHAEALRRLADTADALARREPIAGSSEARRVIEVAAAGTPFATLAPERLLELACRASEHAACSARLEVYPRGLSAAVALELSAQLLTSNLKPEDVIRRVSQRYPLAAALPPRPELDALLTPLRLLFDANTGVYGREGESLGTSLGTLFTPKRTRVSSVLSPHANRQDARAEAAEDFRLALKASIEARSFRVLGVNADRTEDAARALVARFGLVRVSLDRILAAAVRAIEAKHGIDPAAVYAFDRSGEFGPGWNGLCDLMRDAAEHALATLLPIRKPLLLTEPGLIARFRLDNLVRGLLDAAAAPDNEAIILLVPASDAAGVPLVNGTYALRGVLPNQARRLPSAFLDLDSQAA